MFINLPKRGETMTARSTQVYLRPHTQLCRRLVAFLYFLS